MIGKVLENRYVEVDGEKFQLSKHQKGLRLPEIGGTVSVSVTTEYPESCDNDPFCEGDETCIICLCNNRVVRVLEDRR